MDTKLRSLLVCEKVIFDQQNNLISLINILDQINVSGLPVIANFAVFSNLSMSEGQHKGKIVISDPQGTEYTSNEENLITGTNNRQNFIVNWSFPIDKDGTYRIKVFIDGNEVTENNSYSFIVSK